MRPWWIAPLVLALGGFSPAATIAAAPTTAAPSGILCAEAGGISAPHVRRILGALLSGDHTLALRDSTPDLERAFDAQAFETARALFATAAQGGYAPTFLGDLRQGGYRTFLWKISFPAGDDLLLRIVLDGRNLVAGLWFQ